MLISTDQICKCIAELLSPGISAPIRLLAAFEGAAYLTLCGPETL